MAAVTLTLRLSAKPRIGMRTLWRQAARSDASIIETGSFIPLEIWELYRHVTIAKVVVLLLNIAIVAYLIFEVSRSRKSSK